MKNTKVLSATVLALVAAAACPQPTPATTTVDGLTGGTITGDVAADAFNATEFTGETVTATSVDATNLSFDTATGESMTLSGALTTASASVTGSLTAGEVTAGVVDATSIELAGKALLPTILGTALRDGEPGAQAADSMCEAAFEAGAHVCDETEFFIALRHFSGNRAALDGAAVHSPHRQVRTGTDPDGEFAVVADNCEDWTFLPEPRDAEVFHVTQPVVGATLDLTDPNIGETRTAHARSALQVLGNRVTVGSSFRCSNTRMSFACCL